MFRIVLSCRLFSSLACLVLSFSFFGAGCFSEVQITPDVPDGGTEAGGGVEIAVGCPDGSVSNGCGGCAPLSHSPGEPCGPCGLDEIVCQGPDLVECLGSSTNLCGGCEALDAVPGESCGPCDLDRVVCQNTNRAECSGTTSNPCFWRDSPRLTDPRLS